MHLETSEPGLSVSAFAALVVAVFLFLGIRDRRCDRARAVARFGVAFVALLVLTLVLFRVASPVVGYGLLCLGTVSTYLYDLLREEHARRRRVASLTPRPVAEVIPTVWIAFALASVLMLAPYVILDEQRAAAVMVGICAFGMAAIAWRIASAPVQLRAEDTPKERARDRALRLAKAGISSVIAIGTIFVFISFVNRSLPGVLALQRTLLSVSFYAWSGLAIWVLLFSLYLCRRSHSA